MTISTDQQLKTGKTQGIALVAHDACKQTLLDWALCNKNQLQRHPLFATGTTGRLLRETLNLNVTLLHSGPFGGDQQIGAKIVEGEIGLLTFFWDPLESQPHDPDVRALLRLAVLWDIPIANNRATADLIVASDLLRRDLVQANDELNAMNSKSCLPKFSIEQLYAEQQCEGKLYGERHLAEQTSRLVRPKIIGSKKKTGRLIKA